MESRRGTRGKRQRDKEGEDEGETRGKRRIGEGSQREENRYHSERRSQHFNIIPNYT